MTHHRAARRVALPIHHDQEAFERWQQQQVKLGLSAFAPASIIGSRIRAIQPFDDADSDVPSTTPWLAALICVQVEPAHPLKLLQSYSNDDKHRTIRMAVARTSSGGVDLLPGTFEGPFVELRPGDVMAEGTWGQPVLTEVTTAVLVQRPAPYTALVSPTNEISQLTAYVAHVAIPHLVSARHHDSNPLPVEVDLDDSGLKELQRLMAGSQQTAQLRLRPWMKVKYLEGGTRPPKFPKP